MERGLRPGRAAPLAGDGRRHHHLPAGPAAGIGHRAASRQPGGAWRYLSGRDALNSVRQETDAAGQVLAVRRFDPYGVPITEDGGSPYGYSGEWWDAETGLVYLRARYLRPELGLFTSRDPWPGDVRQPGTLNGYSYSDGNPLRFADSSGHWSEEALQAALGKGWRDTYFGMGAAFEGRDKLLAFLTSDQTTSDLTLSHVQSFFQGAGVLRGLGSDLSNFDAMGMRLSGNVGVGAFAAVSVDAILNLSAGEFSYFASPEVGVLLGDSVQIVGGITLIKRLPSNDAYRGAFWAGGGLAGAYGSITGELFWGAPMSDRFDPRDTAHGGFVGAGAAVPEFGCYGSLSYSLEVYREDTAGSHWYSPLPQLRQLIGDLQQVIYHDVGMSPIWPWSPYR